MGEDWVRTVLRGLLAGIVLFFFAIAIQGFILFLRDGDIERLVALLVTLTAFLLLSFICFRNQVWRWDKS